MREFQINRNRDFLMQRVGDMSQLAGLKRYQLIDGKAAGIEAVDCRTGGGFNFTVLPGRGMDIAWTEYRGVPISYISKTGIVPASYYESEGLNWLRTFFAGLLTTCGLSNVGGPCVNDDPILGLQRHGLHGRISNMSADNVCVKEQWQGDEMIMTISGRLRESVLHGENLVLQREITAKLGENRLFIKDVVENQGFTERPLMILYHINIGYPTLDAGSRVVCPSRDVVSANECAKAEVANICRICPPTPGLADRVYFHDLKADPHGRTAVALVNDNLELRVYVRHHKQQLPRFTQWNQLEPADYVLGLEPGNCCPVGRTEQANKGSLQTIRRGERRTFELEIGILDGPSEITSFERAGQSWS